MQTKLIHNSDGQRTFALIMAPEDEVMTSIIDFARRERVNGASITGIGAFRDAVLQYFDWEEKVYNDIPVTEQVEVAALVGDIGEDEEGRPAVHIHLVLGRRDGSAIAGHLKSARVRPTLELVVTETPSHLRRRRDPGTGLSLIVLR